MEAAEVAEVAEGAQERPRLVEESSPRALSARLERLAGAVCAAAPAPAEADALQKELFAAVVAALMLEGGFCPVGAPGDEPAASCSRLPAGWRTPLGSYEVMFELRPYPRGRVKVVVAPLGATMLVNAILVDINGDVYSRCVPYGRYVVAPLAKKASMKYRELSHLATILKSDIVGPIRSRILRYHGVASASLVGLPRELMYKILMFLDVRDVMRVARTCADMLWIADDEKLWRSLLERDFSKDLVTQSSSHKQSYMKKLQENKHNMNWYRPHRSLHEYMDHSDYVENQLEWFLS